MTIQIPHDVARGLERMAAARQQSVEEFTVERLRALTEPQTSPVALLRALHELPHPSAEAVDCLEEAIAASRLPMSDCGPFGK